MKKRSFLLSLLLTVLLPHLLFTFFSADVETQKETDNDITAQTGSDQPDSNQMIRVKDGETILQMELDDYVLGVVLGEMPADFELEALKAQAVATRTYTLRNVMRNNKHPDADVCTDSTCCQAYINVSDYSGNETALQKFRCAVTETTDQVITYQGNLIEATYFSCSGGQTEEAVAVWGTSVPYLQSVSSPGEENAKYYERQFLFSRNEFLSKLGISQTFLLSGENITLTYTDGGSVREMKIGENRFSGTEARALLSLPSAAFTVEITDDGVLVVTKGNGHRVGLSQYGAEAMAVAGKKYDEILIYYYSDVTLETFSKAQMHAVFDKEENL